MSLYLEVEDRRPEHQDFGRRRDHLRLAAPARRRGRDHPHGDRPHLLGLADHPDQWEALKAGADMDVAVEEFIRWVTPIHNMCRVANEDYEIGGADHPQGPAGRAHVPVGQPRRRPLRRPRALDVTRSPNNHIAFGFGTHFCLGASLARLEIKVFFEELVRRVDRFEHPADGDGRRHPQLVRLRRQARRHHRRPDLTEGF